MGDKTWLSGLSDAIEAIKDPMQHGGKLWRNLVSSATVPALSAQTARTIDPTLREAETALDAVRARVPGFSQSLPPRRDVWGQPVTREGGMGPDIVSPVWVSTRNHDSVNNALLDQDLRVPGFSLPKDMSKEDYGRYREEAGALSYDGIAGLMAAPGWQALATDDKQSEIDKLVKASRKQARVGMFGQLAKLPPPPPGYSVALPRSGFNIQP
jgi:hypothetical protein